MIKEPTAKHGGLSSIYMVEEENQPPQTSLWPPYPMVPHPPARHTHTNKCKMVPFPPNLWQCPHHKAQAMGSYSCFSVSQRDNPGAS